MPSPIWLVLAIATLILTAEFSFRLGKHAGRTAGWHEGFQDALAPTPTPRVWQAHPVPSGYSWEAEDLAKRLRAYDAELARAERDDGLIDVGEPIGWTRPRTNVATNKDYEIRNNVVTNLEYRQNKIIDPRVPHG